MSQKIIGTILVLSLIFAFGLIFKVKVANAQLTCSNQNCTAANSGITCLCGTKLISPAFYPWCCGARNDAYSSQPECQQACGAVVGGAGGAVAPTLDIIVVLNNIVNWLFAILLIVAAIFIVLAAYYFVTAAGDPERAKVARNYVLYCLIGVIVAFSAKGLIRLVERVVTGA